MSLTIIDLYKTGRLEFVNLLRGSFNGVVIDKISQEVNVFVDQLGERAVFYNNEKMSFLFPRISIDLLKCLNTRN